MPLVERKKNFQVIKIDGSNMPGMALEITATRIICTFSGLPIINALKRCVCKKPKKQKTP